MKKKSIITIMLAVMMSFMMSVTAMARGNGDWNESSYVEDSVKNSFTMEEAEYGFEGRDDVRRMDAAITAARLYEEITGKEIKGDEDDLRDFEDWREARDDYDDDELEWLGKAAKAGILKGVEEDDGDYIYGDDSATRAEMAAFFARLLKKADLDIDDSYRTRDFYDLEDHWAEDEVDDIVSVGLMEGYSSREFGADDNFYYQDMLIVFYRMAIDETDELEVEEFIDAINDCRWVWLELEDEDGSYFQLRDVDTMTVGDTDKIRVNTDISGFINSDADWESSNSSIVKVDDNGKLTAKRAGSVVITAEYEDFEDSITVKVINDDSDSDYDNDKDNDSDNTVTTPEEMIGTQSTISIEVGDTVDLEDYCLNVPGSLKFKMDSNSYVELDGSEVTGLRATKEGKNVTVTATSEGQTIKFYIRVTNMNITTNLDPEVEWAANNSTGTVTFTIRGINEDCEVLLNADSDYDLAAEEIDSDGDWAVYRVQNMEEIGGTTCLVVRVLIDGTQIWESDPEIFYFGD